MSELYCPPEGAMQIEVILVRDASYEGILGAYFWVWRGNYPVSGPWCGCKDGHRILLDSVPQPFRSQMECAERTSGRFMSVCKCMAKVIE